MSGSLQDLVDQLDSMFSGPGDLKDLPQRMFDSVEKMAGELYDAVNAVGALSLPSSLSSLLETAGATPPPPPPPPPSLPHPSTFSQISSTFEKHPYVASSVMVGIGLGVAFAYRERQAISHYMVSRTTKGRKTNVLNDKGGPRISFLGSGSKLGRSVNAGLEEGRDMHNSGTVLDGMLKDAILILAPSPSPSLLLPLTLSLLKSNYVVLVAVPRSSDAEKLEAAVSNRLTEEYGGVKPHLGALRVMIYDPDEPSSLPPFERSLWATLTLRFPVISKSSPNHPAGDPYAPLPSQLASLHTVISLYALNPSPSSSSHQALPDLPGFLHSSTMQGQGSQQYNRIKPDMIRSPALFTLYNDKGKSTDPADFEEQLVTSGNLLLAKNMGIANPSMRVASIAIGELDFTNESHPSDSASSSSNHDDKSAWRTGFEGLTESFKHLALRLYDYVSITFPDYLLVGSRGKDWRVAERQILAILRGRRSRAYRVGQRYE